MDKKYYTSIPFDRYFSGLHKLYPPAKKIYGISSKYPAFYQVFGRK
jgi:hypothetical protein